MERLALDGKYYGPVMDEDVLGPTLNYEGFSEPGVSRDSYFFNMRIMSTLQEITSLLRR